MWELASIQSNYPVVCSVKNNNYILAFGAGKWPCEERTDKTNKHKGVNIFGLT